MEKWNYNKAILLSFKFGKNGQEQLGSINPSREHRRSQCSNVLSWSHVHIKKENLKNYENEKKEKVTNTRQNFYNQKNISQSLCLSRKSIGENLIAELYVRDKKILNSERFFFISWGKVYQTPEYHTNKSIIAHTTGLGEMILF